MLIALAMAMRVGCVLGLLMVSQGSTANSIKPNIIWIMADDLGWGEPGLYPSGSPHGRISTPNLDAFGRGGIQFTEAYAGYTVCAPSRTTLMTGYHSGHFPAKNLSGTSLPPTWDGILLPKMLKGVGYATAGIGKMAPLNNPTEQGFDFFIGQVDQSACHNMYPKSVDTGDQVNNVNLSLNWKMPATKAAARNATMADPSAYNYTVDITHFNSMDWISNDGNMRDPQKPFFLYEAFTVPHAGGWHAEAEEGAPVPSDGIYAGHTDWPDVERDHAAVITYLDNYVGKLVALLQSLGIEDNTIVFFASDNGAHLEGGHDYHFFNSTGGLLGHKRSLYEGGVRSPTMVRWPGTIKPAVSTFNWAFWDVIPTLADLLGVEIPACDGDSILPTLMGKSQQPKEYLYWTWHGTGCGEGKCNPTSDLDNTDWIREQNENGLEVYRMKDSNVVSLDHPIYGKPVVKAPGYGMRMGDWKMVVASCAAGKTPSAHDVAELYYLPTDPFEAHNLNHTQEAATQKTKFLATAAKHGVTCACFQC